MTDHSATVIDNIFSNNFEYETVSGNIITQIADHFPQLMHLKQINKHLLVFLAPNIIFIGQLEKDIGQRTSGVQYLSPADQ